jgi:Asp-tRNA(Asn)/Glu-tRNA(Gln) amidotransferase A subunit family amidase
MSRTEMILAPSSVPSADPIYYKDATELASLIRAKQLSSREIVQALLDRIAAVNPKINAIVNSVSRRCFEGFRRGGCGSEERRETRPSSWCSVHDQR